MSQTRYTKDHEYIRVDGGAGVIGVTDYAQSQLGDVVFVDLPEPGKALDKGAEAAVVESVKAASEIYAPVSGEVIAVNRALDEAPGMINQDPLGEGWIVRIAIKDPAQLAELMDEEQYKAFVAGL